MRVTKSSGAFIGAGVLSAVAASLCCITPVIALLAGSSSIAANISWIAPARPWLIGLSVAVLSFAWYIKLKPEKTSMADCQCGPVEKPAFLQSKAFLGMVTVFAALMVVFPLYAKMFYDKPKMLLTVVPAFDSLQQVKFNIQGMSCVACEAEVNNEIAKVPGVLAYTTSYTSQSSLVTYDKSKVGLKSIETAINKTGYKVKSYGVINSSFKTEPEKISPCSDSVQSCCEKNKK